MVSLNKHNIIFVALAHEICELLKANKLEEAYIATDAFIEYSKKLREENKK